MHPVIPIRAAVTPGSPDEGANFVSMYQKQPDTYGAAQSRLGQSVPVHFEVGLLDGTRTAVQREKSTFFIPR